MSRQQRINQWLHSVLTDNFHIESLAGDASFRRYHRIHLDNAEKTIYILMDAPPEKESIIEFIQVAELMADYVNVPDIIAKNIDEGFLLLQDFGKVEFAHLLKGATKEEVNQYYQQAMQALINIQKIPLENGQKINLPNYDKALLMQEMDLFTGWFLPYVNVEQTVEFGQLWEQFTRELIAQIEPQPQVIVHRDYHSRNLMQDKNPQNSLGIIDFQDAVIGAYSYDIISLLRDAYTNFEKIQINQWLADFYQMLPSEIQQKQDFQQFHQDVIIMAVQRHLKVLGIFVRLSERDGKDRYLNNIPKVMNDLLYALNWLKTSANGDIQALADKFLDYLNTEVMANYIKKFSLD